MSDESAVLEPGSETSTFDYTQYREYFPAEVATQLEEVFSQNKFGKISKAKLLQDIKRLSDMVAVRRQKLIDSFTANPGRPSKSPRDNGRTYLTSLTEAQLKLAAKNNSVSWNAFVKPGSTDYSEVIEAILDEMERED